MNSKYWLLIFVLLVIICGVLSICLFLPGKAAETAEIWSDGVLVKRVSLQTDQTFTVVGENGTTVVTVSAGKISVSDADCPDHYCMQRGFCNSGAQIVCLPNRLVIKFADSGPVDGAVG